MRLEMKGTLLQKKKRSHTKKNHIIVKTIQYSFRSKSKMKYIICPPMLQVRV